MTASWWAAFPPAETTVTCGDGEHRLRWVEGRLAARDHPDAEGELVLAALGGERPRCVELLQAWGDHSDDFDVLALGPRSASDELTFDWEVAEQMHSPPFPRGWASYGPGRAPGIRRARPVPAAARAAVHRAVGPGTPSRRPLAWRTGPEQERARGRRAGLLSLFALGPSFQFRLSATVAAAWADDGPRARDRADHRPALTAALAGRLAPAAAAWLAIDPDLVRASLHDGPGWGRLGRGPGAVGGSIEASLPLRWVSQVWAPGLAVVAGHLVVAVEECSWPDARVLALPVPDADPIALRVHADGGNWSVRRQDD